MCFFVEIKEKRKKIIVSIIFVESFKRYLSPYTQLKSVEKSKDER